jgi:hypothetical protein
MIERITGRRLSPSLLDMSSQHYGYRQFLLTHDDRLDTRRIAYVLYLVPDNWSAADGGQLDFFLTDWRNEPTYPHSSSSTSSSSLGPVQRFVPKRGTFVFFEVTMTSHHQVAEVLRQGKNYSDGRLSISGWFHDANPDSDASGDVDGGEQGMPSLQASSSSGLPEIIAKEHQITRPADGILQIHSALSEQFHLELTAYAGFRENDAVPIVRRCEAFHYFQEVETGEAMWMKALQERSFVQWIASTLELSVATSLDWPSRPIMKFYKSGDRCRQSLADFDVDADADASGMQSIVRLFINVPKNTITIVSPPSADDFALPTSTVMIEMTLLLQHQQKR